MTDFKQWEGFEGRIWKEEVNTRDFIQKNYTPYDGDESFLAGPTDATNKLWDALQKLQKEERAKGGVLDMETEVVSGLTAYGPGYIDPELKDLEKVVGLQTDKPLKRAFMPYGGIKMAEQACTTYGYQPSEKLHEIFTKYTRTHNQAVFDAYTPEMKKARHSHIVTGLPDTYGRGRIIGDYRRVALYGIDYLIKAKQNDFANCGDGTMTEEVVRLREEIALQINALKGMKEMAAVGGGGMSQFYGQMPDNFTLVVNGNHPIVIDILQNVEKEYGDKLKSITKKIDAAVQEEKRFEETIDKKKEEELTAEEKNQREELSKKVVTLRDERNERLRQIGEKDSLVRQIIDLALLTNGMLKGKNLTEFIQRSISLIEK